MTENLKPCPFCGGRAVMVEGKLPKNIGRYSVTCGNCFCATTWTTSKTNAEFDWNRRPAPENKPLTNFLAITKSPEKLAEFIDCLVTDCTEACPPYEKCLKNNLTCQETLIDWLNQPEVPHD